MERDVPGDTPEAFDVPGQVPAEPSGDAAEPTEEWSVEDFDRFEAFDALEDEVTPEPTPDAAPAETTVPDAGPPPAADDDAAAFQQPSLDLGGESPSPDPAGPGDAPSSAAGDEPDWGSISSEPQTDDDFAELWQESDDDKTVAEPASWDMPRAADEIQEIPVVAPPPAASDEPVADAGAAAPPPPPPPSPDDEPAAEPDEPPGADELQVIPIVPPAADDDSTTVVVAPEDDDDSPFDAWDDETDAVPDFAQFTSEEYVQATTQEYAGLAADVAKAAEQAPEQMAVAADIPGIESGIVGLDDVVAATGDQSEEVQAPKASDLPLRVLTALGLVVVFLGSLYQPYLIGALIFIVLGLAAGEIYTVLVRAGHHPLSIFGFVGVAAAMAGTWIWDPTAIPMAILLTLVATLLFFGVVPDRSRPLHNTSLTMLGVLWIGGLGAFAFDIIKSEYYAWLVAALVLTVALMDIGQYFVGRRIGKRPLAPVVSPKKTVEGLVAGVIVALLVGVGFSYFGPFDLGSGLVIGAVVAVVAPIGDLAVSVIKRAIGVKDMSSILPGHGGILDRIDAMIFTIPAMWIAYSWLGLL